MIKKFNDFINEGINTYPLSKVRYFLKRCGLKESEDFGELQKGVLRIEVKPKYMGKYNNIIYSIENIYGWYLSNIYLDFNEKIERKDINFKIPNVDLDLQKFIKKNNLNPNDDDYHNDIYTLEFEQKTGTPIDYDKLPDILYHVSDKKYLDKILKMGLIPKSKNKKAYHPDRIYLTTDKQECTWLYNDPDFDVKNPILFKIDRNKLEEKEIYLYEDPYLPSGVFAVKNIPKDCLISYNISNI